MVTGTSGSHQRVKAEDLLDMDLVVPTDSYIDLYVTSVRPLVQAALTKVHESQTLAALRDTLLPKLLSGEIRVKDADRLADAAT